MGRLDIDTEGLLILTTDGKLTHSLLSPKTHVPKTYAVGLRDSLSVEQKEKYTAIFSKGFWIDREQNEAGFDCSPSILKWCGKDEGETTEDKKLCECAELNSSGRVDCFLTIYEGKIPPGKENVCPAGKRSHLFKTRKNGFFVFRQFTRAWKIPGTYRRRN